MTDPLLTIDEATRTFRTSPKTIRRRLAAGEIEGAYKRPGDRGPEWVMPAGSLVAAGFPLRPGAVAPALPDDPTELAAYWERRAIDAESAEGPRREPQVDPATARWRIPALTIGVLLLMVLAFIAGQLSVGDGDGRMQVSDTRSPVPGDAPDRGASRDSTDLSPATAAPETDTTSSTPAAETESAVASAPPASPSMGLPGEPLVGGAGSGAGADPAITGATHTVAEGESFWTVATEVVAATGESSTGAVTQYWADLLDANADRLVQPGNPDLLHVGQVLVLPPAG